MIDQNRDGFIDHEDLKDMLASLGELIGTLMVMISTEACFHNEIICGLLPPSLPSSSFLLPPFLPHSLPPFSLTPSFHTGQEPSDKVVDGMMSEAPGPLNFTMFLTLFGEKLTGRCFSLLARFGCEMPCQLAGM